MSDLDFTALLCSRLCHDLISPVGAISNGIEILVDEDDDAMREEVMKLLEQSAAQTSNRLKFFRLSFGAAGGFGELVPLREAEAAVHGLFSTMPVELNWKPQVHQMNKNGLKLLLNMILIAGESLIRGGRLLVDAVEEGGTVTLEVTVHGERVILQDKVRDVMCGVGKDGDIEAKVAPAFLAASVAAALGSRVEHVHHSDESFSFRASYQEKAS